MNSIAENLINMRMETKRAKREVKHCEDNEYEYAQSCLGDVEQVLITLDIVSIEQLGSIGEQGISLENFLRIAVRGFFDK